MIAVLFFFQAEDGIRDGRVTGVQTCALPICAALTVLYDAQGAAFRLRVPGPRSRAQALRGCGRRARRRTRSEERRVGKECRSRWSRKHGKRKKNSEGGGRVIEGQLI